MRRQLLPALGAAMIGLAFVANTLSASASDGTVYAPNQTVTFFETAPAADCPGAAPQSPCTVEVIASVYETPAPASSLRHGAAVNPAFTWYYESGSVETCAFFGYGCSTGWDKVTASWQYNPTDTVSLDNFNCTHSSGTILSVANTWCGYTGDNSVGSSYLSVGDNFNVCLVAFCGSYWQRIYAWNNGSWTTAGG